MSIKDVIKSSIYEKFAGGTGMSFWSVCIILLFSCVVGLYIYIIYKNFSRSALYSKDLNITMAGMTLIVAAIMIAMQSNLLVSLGMVGALSIVRFRTAVKNPMDLLYLFWSISAGIICGVGLYVLGIVLSVMMTVLMFVLNKIPQNKAPAVLVIKASDTVNQDDINRAVRSKCGFIREASIVVKNGTKEVIYEVRTKSNSDLIDFLNGIDGIMSVSWIEHHGEMRI